MEKREGYQPQTSPKPHSGHQPTQSAPPTPPPAVQPAHKPKQ